MNELEKMIWAATFANEFSREFAFRQTHAVAHLPVEDISGFGCAEVADLAIEKFREAIKGIDGNLLVPSVEGWTVRP